MKKLIVLLNIVFCFVGGVYAQDDVFLETAKDSISAAPVVNPNILCEDTCSHVHGIDLSHYQGNVFWEAVGDNTKMAYVYLKATEGGDRIDATFERNIEMAHRHGLKVGSYHFYRPLTDQQKQLQNFMSQCLPREQDCLISGGLIAFRTVEARPLTSRPLSSVMSRRVTKKEKPMSG